MTRTAQSSVKTKGARQIVSELLIALFGWLFIAPWAACIPKCKNKIAVIGRENGKFLDNAKYFFLESTFSQASNELHIAFITEHAEVAAILKDTPCRIVRYPSLQGIWFLLRCAVVVVDSNDWYKHFRAGFLVRAKTMQLWHGVGLKKIGMDRLQSKQMRRNALCQPLRRQLAHAARIFSGSLHKYSAVNSTSIFYRDHVFKKAFRGCDFPVLGYPRNTFGQLPGVAGDVALRNTDHRILHKAAQWCAQGKRIVVIAPTYRETRATLMGLTPDVIAMLDTFCAQEGVEFVLKLHPFEQQHCNFRVQHLHSYNSHADIYPLLPYTSALVTDYSSICTDYLLLDKPTLFLVPDLVQYTRQDRQLQFDYDAMTPGPKLQSWSELPACLAQQWAQDTHQRQRHQLRTQAFGNEDAAQATTRIISYMASKRWISHPLEKASENK